jgi:hypothetical protein
MPSGQKGLAHISERYLAHNNTGRSQSRRQADSELETRGPTPQPGGPITRRRRSETPRRRAQWWPLLVGVVVVAALVGVAFLIEGQLQSNQDTSQATIRALWVGNLAATYQAGTQTQVGSAAATRSAIAAGAQQTQAAQSTSPALTPSATTVLRPAASQTLAPLLTLPPATANTPPPVTTLLTLADCLPANTQAGLIMIQFQGSVAPAASQDEVKADTGDTAATITVNGQPTTPMSTDPLTGKPLNPQGRTDIAAADGNWYATTYAQSILGPGVYEIAGNWHFLNGLDDSLHCTLTVTGP